ncbi:hypothetical protein BwSH20_44290 [Bradyrhizobium ottawaense]|nr:hypothetical protein SG09_24870 [Bradyrhizobium ottawaense]GMO24018.1 hypothetical protein BwSF21_20570 [Bradyrhizobium ottawaense]GMO28147.1 hypothetical protein BwSF12_24880 [Bradyrhizobium ottawaense]GMO44362.1 hypothetical protein BwSH14_58150 [Bradyrhizobium ottawaense]GMO71927.1 hypothetical protein BwSG20_38100 [Bradyrhizobium ottawaense]
MTSHSEQIGHRRTGKELDILAQQTDCSVDDDAPRLGKMLPGDRREQRRLPDAIATDEAGPLGAERQIDV